MRARKWDIAIAIYAVLSLVALYALFLQIRKSAAEEAIARANLANAIGRLEESVVEAMRLQDETARIQEQTSKVQERLFIFDGFPGDNQ